MELLPVPTSPGASESVPATLQPNEVTQAVQELTIIRCLNCQFALDWHQPDPRNPDRLLGVCVECGSWHLLDCRSAANQAFFTLLVDSRHPRPDPQPSGGIGGGPPEPNARAVAVGPGQPAETAGLIGTGEG